MRARDCVSDRAPLQMVAPMHVGIRPCFLGPSEDGPGRGFWFFCALSGVAGGRVGDCSMGFGVGIAWGWSVTVCRGVGCGARCKEEAW